MIIAIDFDGTIVEHKFPDIGREVPDAFRIMRALVRAGHSLILWTMRSDIEEPKSESKEIHPVGGLYFSEAMKYCNERGVFFWGRNTNPEQSSWTHSPKAYAHLYIDDAALGCPLIYPGTKEDRPYVDWKSVEKKLVEDGVFGVLPVQEDKNDNK